MVMLSLGGITGMGNNKRSVINYHVISGQTLNHQMQTAYPVKARNLFFHGTQYGWAAHLKTVCPVVS
jgi:hypothetical protein